jgi:hypothetical protein
VSMTIDPTAAVYQTDQYLLEQDMEREELHEFWLEYTPEGKEVDITGGYGAWFSDAVDDDSFFLQVVMDMQRFLFGDEENADKGIPAQPAEDWEITGCFDSMAHMRMISYLDFATDSFDELLVDRLPEMEPNDFLVVAGQRIPIEGEVYIVSMDEPGGLDIADKCKRKKNGKPKGFTRWPKPLLELAGKHPKYARLLSCVHWDAGWSAAGKDRDGDGLGDGGGAFGMLIRRGLGTCMGIDRPRLSDGRVVGYQWLDPGLYYGWHAGAANSRSGMSFDLSNAVYAKYADKYDRLCGISRPLLKISGSEKVGRGKYFLGHYRDQVLTLLRVLKAFANYTGLPLVWPTHEDGKPLGRKYTRVFKDDYHGVMEHRHLPTTTKWDCRGLDAQVRVLLLKDAKLMAEFPSLAESMRLHDKGWAAWLDKIEANWKWAELGIG